MNERTYKYGGREFDWRDISAVRRLALAPIVVDFRAFAEVRDACGTLVFKGLANVASNDASVKKYEVLTYTPTDELLALKAKHDASIPSFDDFALTHGKDISPAACKAALRRKPMAARSDRIFPSIRDVAYRALVEAQSPLFTHSPPVEPGDELQFSSRGLTDWYVGEFCRINHLHL